MNENTLKPKKTPSAPPMLDTKSTNVILGVSLISVYCFTGKKMSKPKCRRRNFSQLIWLAFNSSKL